jgi:hypothetical protein
MSILITSNGEQALVIGDAITSQLISIAHPRLEAELWVLTG